MQTTRFVNPNYAVRYITGAALPVVKTPTPAAHPNYPASNLITTDRYVQTQLTATGGDMVIYIDIGGSKTVDVVGFLNMAPIGGPYPTTFWVQASNSAPPDTLNNWPGITPQLSCGGLADYLYPVAPVVYRYWKWTFPFMFNDLALGKLVAGRMVDLGIAFSPGSTDTVLRQRVRNRSVAGAPVGTTTGLDRVRADLQFINVTETTKNTLVTMAKAAPVPMLDAYGRAMEVDLSTDALPVTAVFGPPDIFTVNMTLEQMP